MKNLIILTLLMCSALSSLIAQFDQNIETITIKMNDGKTIKGIFVEMDQRKIVYVLDGKNYTVDKDNVESYAINNVAMNDTEEISDRKKYQESYFLFPSALPAGKGTYYYRNYNIIINQFTFGINDHLTMSGGFESASIFSGAGVPIFYLSPKFSFGKDNVHFGIGTLFFIYEDNNGGLLFTNMTLGSQRSNFTIGVSKAYFDEEVNEDWLYNFNCALPMGNKVSFIVESIFYQDDFDGFRFLAFDAGLRYTTQSGIAIDASLIRPDDFSGVLPLLGLTLPFGRKRSKN